MQWIMIDSILFGMSMFFGVLCTILLIVVSHEMRAMIKRVDENEKEVEEIIDKYHLKVDELAETASEVSGTKKFELDHLKVTNEGFELKTKDDKNVL